MEQNKSKDNMNKIIKRNNVTALLILEVLLIVILTGLSVYFTGQLWMILFGVIILGSFFYLYIKQRNKYENDLEKVTDMIEAMISESDSKVLSENDDYLTSKIQHQLIKLNGIIITYKENSEKDRQEIRNLIVEIAHQLRMPLANIQTYIDLLKDNSISNEEKTKYINAIEISENNLSFLIESFIKMSRLENKIIQIRKTDSDLQETIGNAMNQVHSAAENKNILIELNTGKLLSETETGNTAQTPNVEHDRNWLGEAIFNLLDNAVKYSPENSEIEINCIKNEMFTQIEVRDHGIGIEKSEENKVFQRFYRGEKVTNEEGFGLGLYISREIVSAHGGFMRVKRLDDGTSFSIYLPDEKK